MHYTIIHTGTHAHTHTRHLPFETFLKNPGYSSSLPVAIGDYCQTKKKAWLVNTMPLLMQWEPHRSSVSVFSVVDWWKPLQMDQKPSAVIETLDLQCLWGFGWTDPLKGERKKKKLFIIATIPTVSIPIYIQAVLLQNCWKSAHTNF